MGSYSSRGRRDTALSQSQPGTSYLTRSDARGAPCTGLCLGESRTCCRRSPTENRPGFGPPEGQTPVSSPRPSCPCSGSWRGVLTSRGFRATSVAATWGRVGLSRKRTGRGNARAQLQQSRQHVIRTRASAGAPRLRLCHATICRHLWVPKGTRLHTREDSPRPSGLGCRS